MTCAGLLWAAELSRVREDPKPTQAVLDRAAVWGLQHHRGDLLHWGILWVSFNSTGICLCQSKNVPALGARLLVPMPALAMGWELGPKYGPTTSALSCGLLLFHSRALLFAFPPVRFSLRPLKCGLCRFGSPHLGQSCSMPLAPANTCTCPHTTLWGTRCPPSMPYSPRWGPGSSQVWVTVSQVNHTAVWGGSGGAEET